MSKANEHSTKSLKNQDHGAPRCQETAEADELRGDGNRFERSALALRRWMETEHGINFNMHFG
jgi:hypothetical protein